MSVKKIGSLTLKFKEAHITQRLPQSTSSHYYLKISFGGNYFTTSKTLSNHGIIKWEDSMKFIKTSEETITIECFSIDPCNKELKLGSSLFPIQTAVIKGAYKGLILLTNLGKVCLRLNVEISFEEKNEGRIEHPTVIYPLPPPELPHVHAYSVPPNFVYTPPAYYQVNNGGDSHMN